MTSFDTIKAECPLCGVSFEFQSKTGPCLKNEYTLQNVPFDVLTGVVGNRHLCDCGKMITFGLVERRMFIPMLEAR